MALSTPLRNRLPSSAQRQAADRHHIILVPGLDQDIRPGRIVPGLPPLRHLRILQTAHYGDLDPTHGWLATR